MNQLPARPPEGTAPPALDSVPVNPPADPFTVEPTVAAAVDAGASADFSTLFEFLPVGAYRSSPQGQMLRANAALVRLNGYDSEAELLARVADIASEWYVLPGRRQQFVSLLESAGQVLAFESQILRHKSREVMWISENAHLVRDNSGAVAYYEGTVEDISARKQAEWLLRQSEQRWKLALESTGDGLWDWDLETGVEVFSRQMRLMFGFGDALPDRPDSFDGLTHPDDVAQMLADRQAHFNGQMPSYVNEHRIRCQDGSWKWVLSRGMVIRRDPAGRPLRMIGTHTDISERKRGEELRAARDQALAADRAKGALLSRVSHELRTPLNAVLGFAQLMDVDPATPAQQRAWVGHILASGRHLLGLVDDLLDLSVPVSGSISANGLGQPAWPALDLAPLLAECWAMVAAGQDGPQVEFVNLAAQSLQPATALVRADPRRLMQVLVNLLSNAVKYNRPGGQVLVDLQHADGQLVCSVRDTGPGLSPAHLARLFTPFDRLGLERSAIEGRGLGLALSRQLTADLGGSLSVHSSPGQGCCFSLHLPAT